MQELSRPELVIREILSTVQTHIRGMWRYRWPALLLAWVGCLVGWVSVYYMPDVYQANARIYVDTQNVIEPLLKGIAISSDVMDEVAVVAREMVSRPNLAEVARATDMDIRATNEAEFDRLLSSIQQRISVNGNRNNIFTISFRDTDRSLTLSVVQSLVKTFVEKSLGGDRIDTSQAQAFLRTQIDEYAERLTVAEDRLADFKRKNFAYMPGQEGGYFARLQAANATLSSTQSKLRIATQQRAELARQLRGNDNSPDGLINEIAESMGNDFASVKIRELEAELQVLRLDYTDKHPRIGQILETIEALKKQRRETFVRNPDNGIDNPLIPSDENLVYQNLRIQLSNIDIEVVSLKEQLDQQQKLSAGLKLQVDTITQVEAELKRLDRDYSVVYAKYQQLLQKLESANIGEDVSKSIDEVQFRIIDPPFADSKPMGPNRPLYLTATIVLALCAGGVLAFLLNQLNPVFFSIRTVRQATGLPVLASVSLLQTRAEVSAEKLNNRLLILVTVMLIVSFVAVTNYAGRGSHLVRSISEQIL